MGTEHGRTVVNTMCKGETPQQDNRHQNNDRAYAVTTTYVPKLIIFFDKKNGNKIR